MIVFEIFDFPSLFYFRHLQNDFHLSIKRFPYYVGTKHTLYSFLVAQSIPHFIVNPLVGPALNNISKKAVNELHVNGLSRFCLPISESTELSLDL